MPSAPLPTQPLYRPEAVCASRAQQLGQVLVNQPLSYWLIALLAGLLTVMITAFGYYGSYTRKATLHGLLMPEQGMLRLSAPGTGILSEVLATEGQRVDKGDVLVVISGERQSGLGDTQALIAEQLQRRQEILERRQALADERLSGQQRMLDSRLTTIASELRQFSEEHRLLKRRVELAHAHFARQQQLAAAGFIAAAQLQTAESELLALQGQLQATQRARAGLERERTGLLAQQQEAGLRHRDEMSDVDGAMAQIKQEQAENGARSETRIVAPHAGTVTGLNVQVGQQVSAGTVLASLLPDGSNLNAHLYAASRQAGFIEPGQPVLMRYAAYPYQKFGMARGRVVSITQSPYAVQELPSHIASSLQDQGGPPELFYGVTVALDANSIRVYGHAQPLQAGMLLEADVVQDRRRLYEWALEPLYSVTGRLRD